MNSLNGLRVDIPHSIRSFLTREFAKLSLVTGERVWNAGDTPDRVIYVESGMLRSFYPQENGRDLTKHFYVSADFVLPFATFRTGMPIRYAVEAIEESVVFVGSLATLTDAVRTDETVRAFYYRLVEHTLYLKERRSESLLVDSPEQRYREFQTLFPEVAERARAYMIASYIGVTPEALSRIKARIDLDQ